MSGEREYYKAQITLEFSQPGWVFWMPAEHGPPGHTEHCGDICVGPYPNEDMCQRQATATSAAQLGKRIPANDHKTRI